MHDAAAVVGGGVGRGVDQAAIGVERLAHGERNRHTVSREPATARRRFSSRAAKRRGRRPSLSFTRPPRLFVVLLQVPGMYLALLLRFAAWVLLGASFLYLSPKEQARWGEVTAIDALYFSTVTLSSIG